MSLVQCPWPTMELLNECINKEIWSSVFMHSKVFYTISSSYFFIFRYICCILYTIVNNFCFLRERLLCGGKRRADTNMAALLVLSKSDQGPVGGSFITTTKMLYHGDNNALRTHAGHLQMSQCVTVARVLFGKWVVWTCQKNNQ